MRHYFYVVDDEGQELPGSRRSIDKCATPAAYSALREKMEAQLGDDCHLRQTIEDFLAYRRERGW